VQVNPHGPQPGDSCANAADDVGCVLAAVVIICRIPIREAFTSAGFDNVFRLVSVVLASVYLLGLVVLTWAPETKGKPLPTDDDEE